MGKLRINILSPGRFHVCDLARELDKNGFDVRFYSFVPSGRTQKFGLPKRCSSSIIIFMAPFLLMERVLFPNTKWSKRMRIWVQDIVTGLYMRKCDILIAMSGDFLYAVKKAKRQGALVILERGSKHILEQRRILEAIPSLCGKKPVPDINVIREIEGYGIADFISIPSSHVKDSFILHHYPVEKLFVNPYGVDLSMFYPSLGFEKEYDIIMVGGWGYRKGCDLIYDAILRTDYKFLHVGGLVDMPFPHHRQFTHIDSVDQAQLVSYYKKAKILVLPSREEGLAMVQAQAIACNLPIVGSRDSGAVDLKDMMEYPEFIVILETYTVEALIKAISEAMEKYVNLNNRIYAGKGIGNLTWKAYGKRYANFLHTIID